MNGTILPPHVDPVERQNELVAEFGLLDGWSEKYQHLIELGRRLPPYPERLRKPIHIVSGCQAQVWLAGDHLDGRLLFHGESDSSIVAGLVALLLTIYSGQSPAAILAAPTGFLHRIGLDEHLSPHRAGGLTRMLDRIRQTARRHEAGAP